MIKLCVMSRFQASKLEYPLQNKTGIISIYGTLQEPLQFKEDPNLIGVLHLQFNDVDEKGEGGMLVPHAKMIYQFLDQYAKELDTLIVHCNFGACRSAAIAAAIMKAVNGDDTEVFTSDGLDPNMHCYRLTLKELLDDSGKSKLDPGIHCEFIPREWDF